MTDFELPDERNIRDAISTWDIPPTVQTGSNNYALVSALLSSVDEVDDSLELIYDSHHINTATGDDLDRIGDFISAPRETNETDERYRTRIKARFRAGTIEPTTDNFSEFIAAVLATSINNFTINVEDSRPEVTISAQSSIWQSNNLNSQTLVSLLERGVPAGHAVNVQESGTFRLKVDGEVDNADKGLTSDNISTGGTLAGDLI